MENIQINKAIDIYFELQIVNATYAIRSKILFLKKLYFTLTSFQCIREWNYHHILSYKELSHP